MILERPRLSLPFTVRAKFRRRHCYLFPQISQTQDALCHKRYAGGSREGSVYEHVNYLVPVRWFFTWLWLTVEFQLKKHCQSQEHLVQHQPRVPWHKPYTKNRYDGL